MDERVNVAVAVVDNNDVRTKFLSHWTRVRAFAGKDITFLRELEFESRSWDADTLMEWTKTFTGSVCFSEPKYTSRTLHDALVDGLKRYLIDRAPKKQIFRRRSQVVQYAKSQIRNVLKDEWGTAGSAMLLESRSAEASGMASPYQFDIAVANGRPFFCAQGLSFEGPETKRLEKELWSASWLIERVREKNQDLPIGVIVAPPNQSQQLPEDLVHVRPEVYEKAKKQFHDLGAEVLTETEVLPWARRQSVLLADYFNS